MSSDVRTPDAAGETGREASRRNRRRGWIVLAIGVWNLWVWGTRFYNLLTDDTDNTAAFDAVHGVLYVASFALAVVLCVIGWRMAREARDRGLGGRRRTAP